MIVLQVPPMTPTPKAAPVPHSRTASQARRRMRLQRVPSAEERERKRRQHANAERQRSQRKERAVVLMRAELDQLEHTFKDLQQQLSMKDSAARANAANSLRRLRQEYLEALIYSGFLRQEKLFLQSRLQDFGIVNAALQSILDDFGPDHQVTERQSVLLREFEVHEKMHSTRCYDMMRELYEESRHFEMEGRRIPSGGSAMGWSDKRTLNGTEVNFWLSKVIYDSGMESMMENTWRAFHDFSYCQKIFCTTAKLEVLQKISEDMYIMRRTIRYIKEKTTYKCLNFVFRIKTEDGYLISCRTMKEPSNRLQSDGTEEQYNVIDQFYWAKFAQKEDGGCEVTFAGRMNNGKLEYAEFMLVEIPISIMLWETTFARPIVHLRS